MGFVAGNALGPQFKGDLFMGAATPLLCGGYLFHFNLAGNRRSSPAARSTRSSGADAGLDRPAAATELGVGAPYFQKIGNRRGSPSCINS